MADHQSQEYATLREELLQAKRYVFERPLIIVALGVGGLTTLNLEYTGAVALVLSGLILFNFWFTVNRLMSSARIAAYIQIELEEGTSDSWAGWESSLRYYRKWLKLDPEGAKKKVDVEMDNDAVPDAMLNYPPIYQLHIALMASAVAGAFAVTTLSLSIVNAVCAVGVVGLTALFVRECRRYCPSKISRLIERNRVIWGHVFEYMRQEGAKPTIGKEGSAQLGNNSPTWKSNKKPMRRDKLIISEEEAIQILAAGVYGVLSIVDRDNRPYGVPLNYVFRNNCIEFHSATEGHKLENFCHNPSCSFCVVGRTEVIPDKFTTKYESVIVSGKISELKEDEKTNSLIAMLEKYSPNHMEAGMKYIRLRWDEVRVFSIIIDKPIIGKAKKLMPYD